MTKILTSSGGAISVKVIGKINLPSVKKAKAKPKRKFVPRSGGFRLSEVWPR